MNALQIEKLIEGLGILVVDNNPYTRKLTRIMLTNVGAKAIYEAADGIEALGAIRVANPDVMILDWEMPALDGPQVMQIIRSPDNFPKPNLPVIVLTRYGQRSRINAALRLGVHEFLVQPTSPAALRDRLMSIVVRPRPMMWIGKYYVPRPRVLLKKTDLLAAALSAYRSNTPFPEALDSGDFGDPAVPLTVH
ncbi:MAG TPA: response regulator [Pseudolabrys sp.]|nr:response regulator [Pseudolabrys sp.]